MYDIENDEYFISRDVVFHEVIFPYVDTNYKAPETSHDNYNDVLGSSRIPEGCFSTPDVAFSSSDNVGSASVQSLEGDSTDTTDR